MSYSLNILKLSMDHSSLDSNAWLAGFTEADGYFGVSVTEFKPKSETRKRSQSQRVKCRFVIEQRQFDKSTNSSPRGREAGPLRDRSPRPRGLVNHLWRILLIILVYLY